MEIVVREIRPGQFAARLDGKVLCQSRTPLLSAARELLRYGVRESAELTMRHEGSDVTAMRTTVGAAARLTVKEADGDIPRFRPYVAISGIPGRGQTADFGSDVSGIGPEQTAVCEPTA